MKYIRYYAAWVVALLALLAAGCRSERVEPKFPPVTERMTELAGNFAETVAKLPVRAVELDAASFLYCNGFFAPLLDRIALLRFDRIFLLLESADFLDDHREDLNAFIALASARGIETEFLLPQRKFIADRYANVWIRKFGSGDILTPMAEKINAFAAALSPTSRFGGAGVKAEIHVFTVASPELPPNALYVWSGNAYGIGRENDLLMRGLMKDLLKFRQALAPELSFTVAVPDFYHDRAVAGDLSRGTVNDFLAVAQRVVVYGSGRLPSDFARSMRTEFQSAEAADGRVLMGVDLVAHSMESRVALRRRDWADLLNILQYLEGELGGGRSFGGALLGPWRNLEMLWER